MLGLDTDTHFLKRGGGVHQEEGHNSKVRLPNGVHWEPESCWDNIYDAINDARVLCYVVGDLLLPLLPLLPLLLLLVLLSEPQWCSCTCSQDCCCLRVCSRSHWGWSAQQPIIVQVVHQCSAPVWCGCCSHILALCLTPKSLCGD